MSPYQIKMLQKPDRKRSHFKEVARFSEKAFLERKEESLPKNGAKMAEA